MVGLPRLSMTVFTVLCTTELVLWLGRLTSEDRERVGVWLTSEG